MKAAIARFARTRPRIKDPPPNEIYPCGETQIPRLHLPLLDISFRSQSPRRSTYLCSICTSIAAKAIHVNYESESTARSRCWIRSRKRNLPGGASSSSSFRWFYVTLTDLVIILHFLMDGYAPTRATRVHVKRVLNVTNAQEAFSQNSDCQRNRTRDK